MNFMKLSAAGAAASLIAVSSASATSTLEIDLNNFLVVSTPTSDGWNLDLSDDDNTNIENIRIDGVDAPGFVGPFATGPADFVGNLVLVGDATSGVVTGGSYLIDDGAGNTFSFTDVSGSYFDSGTGVGLVLTFASNKGDFSSNTFSGVDVTDFNVDDTLPTGAIGFFFDVSLLSAQGGTDSVADTDITVTIPSPTAATAGLGLMGVMALGKRRRK